MFTQLFRRALPDKAEEHFRQGLYYRNRRGKEFNFELAIRHFKEAIKLNPEVGRYHTELGKAYVAAPLLAITRGIGNSLKIDKCLELAIPTLEHALQCDPSQIETYLVLGEAYLYAGRKNKALDAFRLAINIPTTSFIDSLFLKSYAKRRLKHLEQDNNKAQPELALEYLKQAISHRNDGNYHLAEKKLMQAFKLAPSWSWLYKTICNLVS